ncbi:G-protein coupled receptor 35-like [Rhinichthys klamathensis goyatoka]|uniref:G-protein coupled receptor 35-like n=1 Tax=Rhinichthys klamathensis goyatoka TaxID=3034132 RepID=UPI0024B4EA8E|nr:G-protein coupled receptor 35-like [Rhinichthys klamathensis goyatoka]
MNNSTVNFTTEASAISRLDVCVYLINVLFGFPTHSYVIWLIITGTGNGVASEFFLLKLSVCEIGICLYSLLVVISFFTGLSRPTILACFLIGLFITGRPLFQCLMCVERYLAVVHPVTFLKYKPLRYRVICCTAAWIIILGSCLVCMFTTSQVNFYIYIYFYFIQFLLFLSVQLFCLVAVLRALKQSGPGERGREREEENPMKRRAFHVILITTVTMSTTYIPLIFAGFSFVLTQLFIVGLFSFGLLCFILAGFVQPVLYLHRTGKLSCLFHKTFG